MQRYGTPVKTMIAVPAHISFDSKGEEFDLVAGHGSIAVFDRQSLWYFVESAVRALAETDKTDGGQLLQSGEIESIIDEGLAERRKRRGLTDPADAAND